MFMIPYPNLGRPGLQVSKLMYFEKVYQLILEQAGMFSLLIVTCNGQNSYKLDAIYSALTVEEGTNTEGEDEN
jgi:hypothetical protein